MSLRSLLSLRPAIFALCGFACIALAHAARAQETPPATLPAATTTQAAEIFADFESGTYDGWTIEGDAFGTAPATDALFPGQITGFRGRGFLCSLHPKKGNSATGKATSRDFTIEKPVIRFKIGGGSHPNEACLNLVVDNQIVRSATGDDTPNLSDASWDVSALVGKKARLEVVDSSTSAERGYILVDDIRFTGRIDFDNLPYQATVKQMADQWISKYHLPGVWCAYIKDGKVVACVADGVKNIETKIPASVDDHLNVGSVSKAISGSLISLFVAKGVISYDAKIREVFPELASKYPSSSLLDATLSQFLTHTSGVPHSVGPSQNAFDGDGTSWRLAVLNSALSQKNNVSPGTAYSYSNSGIDIAVAMVEKASRQSYESWITGDLGKTIGLSDPKTLLWSKFPNAQDVFPYFLNGTTCIPGQLILQGSHQPQGFYTPHGSCSITLSDLCSFALATLNNSAGLPDNIYQKTIHEQSTLSPQTYACWLGKVPWINHAGDTARGEYCYVGVNTQLKRAIIFG